MTMKNSRVRNSLTISASNQLAMKTSLLQVVYVVLTKYNSKNRIKCDQGQGMAAKYFVEEMQHRPMKCYIWNLLTY